MPSGLWTEQHFNGDPNHVYATGVSSGAMMTNVLLGDYPDVFQAGDAVRNAFPGYTGPRPRMQLWHGTADEVLNFVNFGEEIKQWTNVLG